MEKQMKDMSQKIATYELESENLLSKAENKAREKYDLLLQEKDKQVSRFSDTYEKLLVQSHKSTSHKGSDGEKQFEDYANTFIDFKGFELIDKHTQGGSGDFHMRFEEFDVLVDAKNYKKKVPIDQREKIKNDLIKNEHIPFAIRAYKRIQDLDAGNEEALEKLAELFDEDSTKTLTAAPRRLPKVKAATAAQPAR